jgi:hypothetical protein
MMGMGIEKKEEGRGGDLVIDILWHPTNWAWKWKCPPLMEMKHKHQYVPGRDTHTILGGFAILWPKSNGKLGGVVKMCASLLNEQEKKGGNGAKALGNPNIEPEQIDFVFASVHLF